MDYLETLSAYRDLLKSNPGKALLIGGDTVALMVGESLKAAHLNQKADGLQIGTPYEFHDSYWDEENDCWPCHDSACEAARFIAIPAFISLPADTATSSLLV